MIAFASSDNYELHNDGALSDTFPPLDTAPEVIGIRTMLAGVIQSILHEPWYCVTR